MEAAVRGCLLFEASERRCVSPHRRHDTVGSDDLITIYHFGSIATGVSSVTVSTHCILAAPQHPKQMMHLNAKVNSVQAALTSALLMMTITNNWPGCTASHLLK